MSSKKDSTASANGTKYEARLCHVVKRADFDGYGFNLHAEKGRPGQYIGKVDDGSPAEAAGLRQGDRIVEVNGTNITNETHKKVVELIKAVPNETKLLVIDPRADAADLKAAIAKSKNSAAVDVNDNSKQQQQQQQQPVAPTMVSGDEKNKLTNGSSAKGDSSDNNKHGDVNGGSKEEINNKKNADMSANNKAATMTNGDASPKQQKPATTGPAVDQIITDTKALSVSPSKEAATDAPSMMESKKAMNGSSTTANGSTASKEGPKLNLNMTAAELRAQLAARKKYDPKNDVCDLRKKYEIIQKM